MPDFFTLLAMYYACDQSAVQTLLSQEQARRCSGVYQTVKLQFLSSNDITAYHSGDPAQKAAIMQVAYLRFKDWESQNGGQVRDLRKTGLYMLSQG